MNGAPLRFLSSSPYAIEPAFPSPADAIVPLLPPSLGLPPPLFQESGDGETETGRRPRKEKGGKEEEEVSLRPLPPSPAATDVQL